MQKEEENYSTIVKLKEENQRLTKQTQREVAKLSVENEMLKKQVESLQRDTTPAPALSVSPQGSREAEDLKLKLKIVKEDKNCLEAQFKEVEQAKLFIEGQLVEAKLKSANLDLENDQLACKIQHKNEQIKQLGERVTTLEVELLKTKQELGEALNAVCEYEINGGAGAGGTTLSHVNDSAGSGGDSESHRGGSGTIISGSSETDGGSGSTVKKMSMKDKLKKAFQKHTQGGAGSGFHK